jgi:UDP-N-acetylglucosamine/UDP-N-acetylgalactosamine diphosphorylase
VKHQHHHQQQHRHTFPLINLALQILIEFHSSIFFSTSSSIGIMSAALKETVQSLLHGGNPPKPDVPSDEKVQELRSSYESAGQGQVFTFWDDLDATQKSELFTQLKGFQPERINQLADKVLNPPKEDSESQSPIEPLPESHISSVIDSKEEDLKKWYDAGLDAVAAGHVGVVLMAGGQGTRLGSSAPKGCYDIGLPSKKSLFQLQAERILKVQSLAAKKAGNADKAIVPWYVMTSGPTRGPTQAFFEENGYFGLKKENVIVFEQGVLPCLSNDGKILLESKSKVCPSPRTT